MNKYHSTVSRRDFLKALGLGSLGVGASTLGAASTPFITTPARDLDEMTTSSYASFKHPSWVKVAEKPTVEIDWPAIRRFDYHYVMWAAGLKTALGPEQYDEVFRAQAANRKNWLLTQRPGCRLPDVALRESNNWASNSFMGPQTSPTPDSLGVPRWQGTPEENSKLVRAFLRLHGASLVSFLELETETTEKLIYAYDTGVGEAQGPRIDILDVDKPEDNPTKGYRVIPKKARWVVVYTLRMADELVKRPTTQIGDRMHTHMYNLRSLVQGQLQQFLRTLGYMGLGEASTYNALALATPMGVLAGLGEISRVGHIITPEHGLMQRVNKLITDLPLAPGKPVNFGAFNFCRTCKKCADFCPAKAITPATDPTWDSEGKTYFSPGVKVFRWAQERCNAYYQMNMGCATCFAVCPYSKKPQSSYSNTFRASVATNPALNRFWRKADDYFFGAGVRDSADIEKFWDLELPPWGYD
jgi:epoxyqueuosine reductase